MKQLTTYIILFGILLKTFEPVIVFIDILRESRIKQVDNVVLKLTPNHHTDLDVTPINKKKDINCTLSGLRINEKLIEKFNIKIKDIVEQQDNKNKRSQIMNLEQLSNFIIPEKNIVCFSYTKQKQVNIWNYRVKKSSFFQHIISPPPQLFCA